MKEDLLVRKEFPSLPFSCGKWYSYFIHYYIYSIYPDCYRNKGGLLGEGASLIDPYKIEKQWLPQGCTSWVRLEPMSFQSHSNVSIITSRMVSPYQFPCACLPFPSHFQGSCKEISSCLSVSDNGVVLWLALIMVKRNNSTSGLKLSCSYTKLQMNATILERQECWHERKRGLLL